MIDAIVRAAADDWQLKVLLDRAVEYAALYTYAKAQQRGYIGIGEVNNLKEEFRSAFYAMLAYAESKGFAISKAKIDTDMAAADIMKLCGSDNCL